MVGLCEALLYAQKAGLDHKQIVALLSNGGGTSWWLKHVGPRILVRDFEPGFSVNHFYKDMGLILEECRRMNLSLPGLSQAYQLHTLLMAQDRGHLGNQALLLALEEMNRT